jgi:hypothetical protein
MEKFKKYAVVLVAVLALVASAHAEDVIATLSTSATALITSAVTAVTALVVAGFAIVGIMWGARKIKAGIKAA